MAVAVVPPPRLQILGEVSRPGLRLLLGEQRESGDVGPYGGVEIALGPSPVRGHETVLTVVRNRDHLDPGGFEWPRDRFDRRLPRVVELVVLLGDRPVVVEPERT